MNTQIAFNTHNNLSSKHSIWILASVVIAVLPHIPRLPLWFPFLLTGVVTLSWMTATGKLKSLPRLLIAFITILLFLAIIYFQGFSLDRELSVTVLTTMTVLKLLETYKKRDAWMVVTLCYFVILTRFFYSQDMLLMFYLLGSVIVITHTLFVLQHNNSSNVFLKREIKQTLGLLLTGIPLAVLFFIFFPRLGSPIWGSPDLFGQGKTGMSDEMSPGSISELFQDDSTAFRVTFNGKIPAKSLLYWRGPVLWDFDGYTWKKNEKPIIAHRPQSFQEDGAIVDYEIELEPTGQKYLFALDFLINPLPKSLLLSDSQLLSDQKINQIRHYQAQSILKHYNPYEKLSRYHVNKLLALPKGYNPKTIALMQKWKKLKLSPEQLIQKALTLFNQDEYYYSFTPPLLQGNTVDQFLFETKTGFCEHYASAFTVMMRASGLPARVVTGYQGGIVNEDYLLVKQSDAHAWSEVYIPNKGWLRVDPTAAVSPLRIEAGSQALIAKQSRGWLDTSWNRKMGERYDAIRHKWNKWVRDYNAKKQQALFKIIGFDAKDGRSIATVLGAIMLITTLIVLAVLYLARPRRKLNEFDKVYLKFTKLYKKDGLKYTDSQGILAFADEAIKQHPQTKFSVNEFTNLYLKLRYSKQANKPVKLVQRLHNLVTTIAKEIKSQK